MKQPTIQTIINVLNQLAPFSYKESWDNVGLIVGEKKAVCTGVLLCLDLTEAIIQEAENLRCNLIIAHHPVMFKGVRQITTDTREGNLLRMLIQKDLHFCAIHTNIDKVQVGVSGLMAQALSLHHTRILQPDLTLPTIGLGIIGTLAAPLLTIDFLHLVQNVFHLRFIRHSSIIFEKVQQIALCGGSGVGLMETARKAGAHVFITADAKYHDFFEIQNLILMDIGHYESEIAIVSLLHNYLNQNFPTFAIHSTQHNTNLVSYFP